MINVHMNVRGSMDICSAEIPWPVGLLEIEAILSPLLQSVRSWDIPGVVPQGIGGSTENIGDSVRILASAYYTVFQKSSSQIGNLTSCFLSLSQAGVASPFKETLARLSRLHSHLKLVCEFEIVAVAGKASLVAETAVSLISQRACGGGHQAFAEAVKVYRQRMQGAGELEWGQHSTFITNNIGQLSRRVPRSAT